MNNDIQNNNIEEPENYKNVNAEVIGELRKEKIGKPLLVFEIFGLLVIVLIALPFVNEMLNDENSALYKFIHRSTPSSVVDNPQKDEYADGSVNQILTPSMRMKYETIIMKNFTLSGNNIKFIIYSYNGLIDLDKEEYFFEISSNNNILTYFKLKGTLDFQENEATYTIPNFNFNTSLTYYGKVYKITDDDYPAFTLPTDQSGIAKLTCSKDNKVMEYTFKNDYLINIKENYKESYNAENDEEYKKSKEKYTNKKKLLGNYATLTDAVSGYAFTSNINLETPGYMLPDDLDDYDYYPLDTQAKKIKYEEVGKGYECK